MVWHLQLGVKQFTDIPINRGPFKEKNETGSNFTVPVFLQYVISPLMHQKVWFSPKILSEINEILTYWKISKSECWLSFSFSHHWQFYMSVILFTPGHPLAHPTRPLTPQDALYMIRNSFILFYMINYHEVITFLLCVTVSHRRTYKFYNSYWTYPVNSTSPWH